MKRLQKTLFLLLFMAVICLSSIVGMKAEAANNQILYNVKYGQTEARTMLEMINEFRTGDEAWYWQSDNTTKYVATNLQKVVYDYDLEKIAMQRAAEVAASFSHTRPDGTSCFTVFDQFEIPANYRGENLASGGKCTPDFVMKMWIASEGHYKNIKHEKFTRIGVGYFESGKYGYWAQLFAN